MNEEEQGFLKKKYPFLISLGISSLIILIGELIFGLFLNPVNNITYVYLAYMYGFFAVFVMGFLVKSKLKMLFLGAPALVIISFIFPFVLPDLFYGVFDFLALPVNRIQALLSAIDKIGLANSTLQNNPFIESLSEIGLLIDLVLALILVPLGSIGLTWIAQVLHKKGKIFLSLGFYFGLVFTLIFVILLPYLLVIVSGGVGFVSSFATGGAYFYGGVTAMNNGSLDQAAEYFALSREWFDQAKEDFIGIQSMGLFKALAMNPQLAPYIELGVPMVLTLISMAKSAGPMAQGVLLLKNSFENLFAYIDSTAGTSTALMLDSLPSINPQLFQGNESLFLKAVEQAELAVENITTALTDIQDALTEFYKINQDELQNLDDQTRNLLTEGVPLLNDSIGALYSFLDPNSTADKKSAFIHILYGLRSLNDAKLAIGDTTSLNGTIGSFQSTVGNFTEVQRALNSQGIKRLLNRENLTTADLQTMQTSIKQSIIFLNDSLTATLSFGNFGIQMATAYTDITNLVGTFTTALQQYGNITGIPDNVFNTQIIPPLEEIYTNKELNQSGLVLEQVSYDMKNKAASEEYGYFNGPADSLADFYLTLNSNKTAFNVVRMSGKYLSLMLAFLSLKRIGQNMTVLETQIEDMKSDPQISKIDPMNQTLLQINSSLAMTNYYLELAVGNKTDNMPQLQNTDDSLPLLQEDVQNIQLSLNDIFVQLNNLQNDIGNANTYMTAIDTDVNNINGNMTRAVIHAQGISI